MDDTLPTVAQLGLGAAVSSPPGEQKRRRCAAASLPQLHYDRVQTAEMETQLAANSRHAYVNLPPAVDVETVEEAKAMLDRWEAWNLLLQQLLQCNYTTQPPPRRRKGDAASAVATETIACSPACDQTSPHADTSDGNARCTQISGGSLHLHTELATGSGSVTKAVKVAVHPFSVASRATVATTQRRVRPKSTRRSRALLLKRALELVGKPLGRSGSGPYYDIGGSEQLSAERQTLEGRGGAKSPIHSGDFLTETTTPATSKVEETEARHDPSAVVGHLQQRLREEPWISATDSLADLKWANSGPDKNKNETLAWPRPPSRLHRELDEYEEVTKSIRLVTLLPIAVPPQATMEKEDTLPILSSPPLDSSAYAMAGGEPEDAQQPLVKQESVSSEICSDDVPPRGFPIVILTKSAVCIPPGFSTALNELKSEGGDAVAHLAHEVAEAMKGLDNVDGEAEEVVGTLEVFGSPAAGARQPADLSETRSMAADDEEVDCTTSSNAAVPAATAEAGEGDAPAAVEEDEEANMLLASDQSPTASETTSRSPSESEKTSGKNMVHALRKQCRFDEVCAVQELKDEEHANRVALVMEESLQLCELCLVCRSEAMNTANGCQAHFGSNALEEKAVGTSSPLANKTIWRYRNGVATLMVRMRRLERSRCAPRALRSQFLHWRLRRRWKTGSRCLTAPEGNREEIKKKLQSEAWEARLKEAVSAVQEARAAAAAAEARRFREEKARMTESLVELRQRLVEKEQTIEDLHASLRASHTETSEYMRLLEQKTGELVASERLVHATASELRQAHRTLESSAQSHGEALRAQLEAWEARLKEAVSALQKTRAAAAEEIMCEKKKYAALERAANARLTELQRDALESTAREHQALRLAVALERPLLLAKSQAEEQAAKTRLIALELCDQEERLLRARAQTAAAAAFLGRGVFVPLVQRCFGRWMRKCRETKCRVLERVQRESNERRRELLLWRDHVCFASTSRPAKSLNAKSETAEMPLIAATAASTKDTDLAPALATKASESRGSRRGHVGACGAEKKLAQEQQRAAALVAERDVLRHALRDSGAVNSELLAQLEAALRGNVPSQ
ncbi:uncharacterized protein Tco025E_00910 [Trypanosoma conorhini]|uniref:Uncharacterized protein n=1 Tax=Trypanosoma conorhini TaxID=83891 RepID=A0A3R7PKT4_9TRYP|nr:uncharacterized protein Tco025E_00910 [Trypanosoma conorhini]RNF26828.1 hypothetical protein Tco025E_00910 [Trypanosoma conorhini]